jgi:hypothetical protein
VVLFAVSHNLPVLEILGFRLLRAHQKLVRRHFRKNHHFLSATRGENFSYTLFRTFFVISKMLEFTNNPNYPKKCCGDPGIFGILVKTHEIVYGNGITKKASNLVLTETWHGALQQ